MRGMMLWIVLLSGARVYADVGNSTNSCLPVLQELAFQIKIANEKTVPDAIRRTDTVEAKVQSLIELVRDRTSTSHIVGISAASSAIFVVLGVTAGILGWEYRMGCGGCRLGAQPTGAAAT